MTTLSDMTDKKCTCESCPDCKGTGNVWITMGGEYLGKHHIDDTDELETCEECGGRGITELCDYCMDMIEEERDKEDASRE